MRTHRALTMRTATESCTTPALQTQLLPGPARQPHPLGPMLARVDSPHPAKTRLWAALLLTGSLALLALAGWLKPDPTGMGTHRQLGFPPCALPSTLGIPCAGCGLTTAFAHTVRGQWLAALHAQPFGWILCLSTLITAGLAVSTLISGKSWRLNLYRATPLKITLIILGLILSGWAYKIITVLANQDPPSAW